MTKKDSKKREETRKFLEKVVINAGVGRLSQQPNFEEKILPKVAEEVALLGGQKAAVTRAKKSIAGFKIRANQIVGLKITLRRNRAVDFFEKLINIVLPRLRDFNGINPKSIDQKGNLSLGFREQYVFPEIIPEHSTVNFSLEVTIVPRLKSREKAIAKYFELGVPLKKGAGK